MADDAFVSRDGGAFVGRFEAEMRRIDGVDFRFYEAIWRGRERDRVGYDKKASNTTISSDKNKANLNLIANGIIKNLAVNAAQKVNIK